MTRLRRRGMRVTNDDAIWRMILELSRLARDDELAQLLAFACLLLSTRSFSLELIFANWSTINCYKRKELVKE